MDKEFFTLDRGFGILFHFAIDNNNSLLYSNQWWTRGIARTPPPPRDFGRADTHPRSVVEKFHFFLGKLAVLFQILITKRQKYLF